MEFELIAAIFGALIVITRLPVLLWPSQSKRFMAAFMKKNETWMQALGFVCLLIGAILLFNILSALSVAQVATMAFAFGLLMGGFLYLVPHLGRGMVREVVASSDQLLRLLAAIAVAIGLAILYFVWPIASSALGT